YVGLANEPGYSYEGKIDFSDNRVDQATGTMRLRGVIPNTNSYLQPGLYCRVMLPVGRPREALLVTDAAIGSDQGQRFVYVVNAENKVEYRKVEVGELYNGLREVKPLKNEEEKDRKKWVGLKKGERIVVNGLQSVRPGRQIEPDFKRMPNPAHPVQ